MTDWTERAGPTDRTDPHHPRDPEVTSAVVRRAMGATYLVFGAAGFAFASWAARIPQVRDQLDLSSSALGLVLLAIAAGSVVSLPLAGPLIERFGSQRVVATMAVLLGAALAAVALGFVVGVAPVVVALFAFGFANGAWDVGMNVQGAAVERGLDRSIMSRFHAGWSLGTVAGALIGAGMVAVGVPVTAHLAAAAVLVAVVVPTATRSFIADAHDPALPAGGELTGPQGHDGVLGDQPADDRFGAVDAWREPRTLLVGVFVLAFAFAEGAGNDWINVGMIDGYHQADAVGGLAFAAFLAAMTAGRWFGTALLDRHGRVPVVRASAGIAAVGSLVFAFGPNAGTAFLGVLLWGLGAALGFPVGMSAAADDPRRAAVRVSVVASIGYCAFLSGPPLIGFLGQADGVRHALVAVAVLMAVAAVLAGVVRRRDDEPARRPGAESVDEAEALGRAGDGEQLPPGEA